MMFWWCDQVLNGGATRRAFSTMDKVFALEGEQITWSPLSRVLRVECEGKRYYIQAVRWQRHRHGGAGSVCAGGWHLPA